VANTARKTLSAKKWAARAAVKLRNHAKRKGRVSQLSALDLYREFPKDRRCPVLGVLFVTEGRHPYNPSVDRLDPSKGYVRGNIAIISWRANAIKRDATLAELEALVKWLRETTAREAQIKRRQRKPKPPE
jgi:hypothetical protein